MDRLETPEFDPLTPMKLAATISIGSGFVDVGRPPLTVEQLFADMCRGVVGPADDDPYHSPSSVVGPQNRIGLWRQWRLRIFKNEPANKHVWTYMDWSATRSATRCRRRCTRRPTRNSGSRPLMSPLSHRSTRSDRPSAAHRRWGSPGST